MKSAWSYLLNLILIVIIVLMFMGVIKFHERGEISKGSQSVPPAGNAVAYVAIDPAGNPTFVDPKGNHVPRCGIGADPDPLHKPCEGLGGNKGVTQTIKMFGIMTVKGSTCYTFVGTDGTGYQICI